MPRLERLAMFGELLAVMAEEVAVEDAALASATLGAVPFWLSGFPPLSDVTASGLDKLLETHRTE